MRGSLSSRSDTEFEYVLRGKDWDIYWLLLRSSHPMSAREVQKALRFSSPSVAFHHLEQLRKIGLVEKQPTGGSYQLTSEVKIGVLRHFVKLGRQVFPRYFFYAVFTSACYLTYLLVFMQGFTQADLFIMFFGMVTCVITWVEAIRVWTMKPF